MEMQVFNSIRKGKVAKGSLVDRKSRFITLAKAVASPEEAKSFYEVISHDNPDARHVVFAWRILDDADAIQERFCDDGEPSQTAGLPVLEVLRGESLVNVCACVVRYFGGILLGPGGLKRAYAGCTKAALKDAAEEGILCVLEKQSSFCTSFSYKHVKTFEHLLKSCKGTILSRNYEDKIEFRCAVPSFNASAFKAALQDACQGEISLEDEGDFYGEVHGGS